MPIHGRSNPPSPLGSEPPPPPPPPPHAGAEELIELVNLPKPADTLNKWISGPTNLEQNLPASKQRDLPSHQQQSSPPTIGTESPEQEKLFCFDLPFKHNLRKFIDFLRLSRTSPWTPTTPSTPHQTALVEPISPDKPREITPYGRLEVHHISPNPEFYPEFLEVVAYFTTEGILQVMRIGDVERSFGDRDVQWCKMARLGRFWEIWAEDILPSQKQIYDPENAVELRKRRRQQAKKDFVSGKDTRRRGPRESGIHTTERSKSHNHQRAAVNPVAEAEGLDNVAEMSSATLTRTSPFAVIDIRRGLGLWNGTIKRALGHYNLFCVIQGSSGRGVHGVSATKKTPGGLDGVDEADIIAEREEGSKLGCESSSMNATENMAVLSRSLANEEELWRYVDALKTVTGREIPPASQKRTIAEDGLAAGREEMTRPRPPPTIRVNDETVFEPADDAEDDVLISDTEIVDACLRIPI
ncbi:hypothetical protein MMC25_006910 [Agyrium rufum]|nr:hypothetical protein [Agyrium rufum]